MKYYDVTKYCHGGKVFLCGVLSENEVKPMLRGYKYDESLGMWFSEKANVGYDLKEIF